MSAPSFNSDHRPLPPDVDSHYDPHRGAWFYVHLQSNPPRISYRHPADEVAQNQQHAISQPQPQPQQTIHTETSFPQQQAGYQPPQQIVQTSLPQQQADYQPPQQIVQTSLPQQPPVYHPQQPQTVYTQSSFPQQQAGHQPQQPQTVHTQSSFPRQQAGYQPQQPQTNRTQSSFPQQAVYQPQQQTVHTQTSLPQQQGGYQPQQPQIYRTQTSFPQQQAGYQPQQPQTNRAQRSFPQQAGYQSQQQQAIHTQMSFEHQQSYQAHNNGIARVYRRKPTTAQQLYSSVSHPHSPHSSPEDEPRHLFPTSGPIQSSPQSLEFDPYSLYSSTSPRSSSSSNPSTQVSPTSMSPTIQPPDLHYSGYFVTRPRGHRPSISGTSMASRSFTDEGDEFRRLSLFEPAPMRNNSMTDVLEQPINIRSRHRRSATSPPVAPVATNGLIMGAFMKPKEVPVYSLIARPPLSIGLSQQTSQPTSSPQDLSSLPPGAAAPWLVGGMSTNHPAVPALTPTSHNGVMAPLVQNVVQKPLPSQPQVHEGSKTNDKAAAIGKKVLKTTAKAALGIVMPSSVANLAVNAAAAGIEFGIKASKKPKAPEVQQPGQVGAGQNTTLAQSVSPLYPMNPPNPHQFYQQTQQFANSQPQQQPFGMVAEVQRPIVVPQTQMPPQRQSSSLFNSISGAATRAVVSSAMDAALNNTTEPSSNILSFMMGDE